jgi:hypothetical protein
LSNDRYLQNYVPHISKTSFDDKATEFLKKYYPEALVTPMPVPIEDIAKKKIGLMIIEERLTEDLSILGQMCFTKGLAEIYDKENDEYREILVRGGTMIIDPDTLIERNLGCKRNTVSHECVHWTEHRNYHLMAAVKNSKTSRACRCPAEQKSDQFTEQWDDEDWMEWQANGIAPRILMPHETVGSMFNRLVESSAKQPFIKAGLIPARTWIIEQIAGFYQVSKQSAQIRLCELGYLPN